MSMEAQEFLLAARIDRAVMAAWIEAGWLAPHCMSGKFLDVDVARARLIQDLGDMGVNNEGIAVILDLVDQLHGLRRALRGVLAAVDARPEIERAGMPSRPDEPH